MIKDINEKIKTWKKQQNVNKGILKSVEYITGPRAALINQEGLKASQVCLHTSKGAGGWAEKGAVLKGGLSKERRKGASLRGQRCLEAMKACCHPSRGAGASAIREPRPSGLTGSCLLTPGKEESHPRGKGKKRAQEELRSAKYLLEGTDLN